MIQRYMDTFEFVVITELFEGRLEFIFFYSWYPAQCLAYRSMAQAPAFFYSSLLPPILLSPFSIEIGTFTGNISQPSLQLNLSCDQAKGMRTYVIHMLNF